MYFGEPFLWPDLNTLLLLMLGVFFGVVGYSALISAMRIGEISAVTPFGYSRIVLGWLSAFCSFGEDISLTAVLGCLIIVMSSLVVLYPVGM